MKTLLFLQSAGMLPGMLKGERVASLSEAQAQAQNSYLKSCERSAKDPILQGSMMGVMKGDNRSSDSGSYAVLALQLFQTPSPKPRP